MMMMSMQCGGKTIDRRNRSAVRETSLYHIYYMDSSGFEPAIVR